MHDTKPINLQPRKTAILLQHKDYLIRENVLIIAKQITPAFNKKRSK